MVNPVEAADDDLNQTGETTETPISETHIATEPGNLNLSQVANATRHPYCN